MTSKEDDTATVQSRFKVRLKSNGKADETQTKLQNDVQSNAPVDNVKTANEMKSLINKSVFRPTKSSAFFKPGIRQSIVPAENEGPKERNIPERVVSPDKQKGLKDSGRFEQINRLGNSTRFKEERNPDAVKNELMKRIKDRVRLMVNPLITGKLIKIDPMQPGIDPLAKNELLEIATIEPPKPDKKKLDKKFTLQEKNQEKEGKAKLKLPGKRNSRRESFKRMKTDESASPSRKSISPERLGEQVSKFHPKRGRGKKENSLFKMEADQQEMVDLINFDESFDLMDKNLKLFDPIRVLSIAMDRIHGRNTEFWWAKLKMFYAPKQSQASVSRGENRGTEGMSDGITFTDLDNRYTLP